MSSSMLALDPEEGSAVIRRGWREWSARSRLCVGMARQYDGVGTLSVMSVYDIMGNADSLLKAKAVFKSGSGLNFGDTTDFLPTRAM